MNKNLTDKKTSAALSASKNQPQTKAVSEDNLPGSALTATSPAPPAAATVPTLDNPLKHWISNIIQAFSGHVGGDVEAGLQLIQAKAALEHGLWLKLFKPDGLPFSDRIAQKLICIAKNEYFANPKNYSYLPVRREVAYQLSDLSSEILAAGVRKGKITPKMSIKQAVEFTLENGGVSKQKVPVERPFDKAKSLSKLERFLTKEFDLWPEEEREELVEAIDAVIIALGKRELD